MARLIGIEITIVSPAIDAQVLPCLVEWGPWTERIAYQAFQLIRKVGAPMDLADVIRNIAANIGHDDGHAVDNGKLEPAFVGRAVQESFVDDVFRADYDGRKFKRR